MRDKEVICNTFNNKDDIFKKQELVWEVAKRTSLALVPRYLSKGKESY